MNTDMIEDDTWVDLLHRPTDPAIAGGVFADPRFVCPAPTGSTR